MAYLRISLSLLSRSLAGETENQKIVRFRNILLQRLYHTKCGVSLHIGHAYYWAGFFRWRIHMPVLSRSNHAKVMDTTFNETCQIIPDCLKLTPIGLLYPLAGIHSQHCSRILRKIPNGSTLGSPLHDHSAVQQKLRSLKSQPTKVLSELKPGDTFGVKSAIYFSPAFEQSSFWTWVVMVDFEAFG